MKYKLSGWKKLNELAREYYLEVQNGSGTKIGYQNDGSFADNRSPTQKELADKIMTDTKPYFYHLAQELLNGKVQIYSLGPKLSLKRYHQISMEDLVQEAMLNIIKCLKNFQPAKGSISTFIHYNAIAAMCRYAKNENSFIKIPSHLIDKVEKYISEGRKKCVYQIMKETSTTPLAANAIYCGMTNKYIDLNGITGADPNFFNSTPHTKVEETIADENAQTDKKAQQQELEARIQRVLATLTPREELVMRMRFGIKDDHDQSLEKIAEKLGITRQRVRQIELKALQKLRHYTRSRYLNELVD